MRGLAYTASGGKEICPSAIVKHRAVKDNGIIVGHFLGYLAIDNNGLKISVGGLEVIDLALPVKLILGGADGKVRLTLSAIFGGEPFNVFMIIQNIDGNAGNFKLYHIIHPPLP